MRGALLLLATVLCGGLAAGCGADSAAQPAMSGLEDAPWVLVAGLDVEEWQRAAPSATFAAGRIAGSTGCNSYSASYSAGDERLELGPITATLIGCGPPADAVERAYVASLERIAGWAVTGGELTLSDAAGVELLRFAPASPIGEWEVTGLRRAGSVTSLVPGSRLTATFGPDGTVAGSAGCNSYRTTFAVDGRRVSIGPPAATRMACPEPAGLMAQEAAFLDALAATERFRLGGRALELLDAGDAVLVTMTRAG